MAIGKQNSYTRPGLTGLVFVEPKLAPVNIEDDLTRRTQELVQLHIWQTGGCYKGTHCCSCGPVSDTADHYFTPPGRKKASHVTHSLLLHYVQFHRTEIPAADLAELELVLALADGTVQLSAPAGQRTHRVLWAIPGQRPNMDAPLRRGTYEQCIEFLRVNWDRLHASSSAREAQLHIFDAAGRHCSFVL